MIQDAINGPQFPVLVLSDGYVHSFSDMQELSTASTEVIKTRYFEHMLVIDASGDGWKVSAAVVERFLDSPWTLTNVLFRVRKASFKLQFERPVKLTLDQIKAHVTEQIRSNSEVYDSAGEMETFLKAIASARDFAALLAALPA